jgi:hypothetical protein
MMIVGITLIRLRQNEQAYYGVGERLPARYMINMRGKGNFHCRLTEVDPMLIEEWLEIIKKIPEIVQMENGQQAIDKLKELIIKKQLFAYFAKIIDKKYFRFTGNVGYGMVLSTGNLNDPKYYYTLKKGITSLTSPIPEIPRVVECLKQSKHYDLPTETRRIAPVFVIAPMFDPENNREVKISDGLEMFEIPPVYLTINLLMQAKEIAQIMLILQTTADLYQKYSQKTMQMDNLHKMYADLQDEAIAKQLEGDVLRGLNIQQELEKLGESEIKREGKEGWVWLMVAITVGIFSIILPNQIPELSTMPPVVSFMIAEVIVIILKYVTDKKKESPEERMKNRSVKSIESAR